MKKLLYRLPAFLLLLLLFIFSTNTASAAGINSIPTIFNIRLEFILFGLTLACVAIFNKKTTAIALLGLSLILFAKFFFEPHFSIAEHLAGKPGEKGELWILLNLFGLLLGFAILAKHFQNSGIPELIHKILPHNWTGGLILLFVIMIISSFLDNIAAAVIGGSIAFVVYRGKVHIGYLAAIVAASNAGGAGSVIGDTTTTLMWIDGVEPFHVLHAFIASFAAFLIFGIVGSIQQDKFQRIQRDSSVEIKIDLKKIITVVIVLAGTIITNYVFNFPALGVWLAIIICSIFTITPWEELTKAIGGTVFLIALVIAASLMPVDELPKASWGSTFILGFMSSIFDNIPLTKLCLKQGGYDWGVLAYTVGFGGSMLWFGSSAGVALSNEYHEIRSVTSYVK